MSDTTSDKGTTEGASGRPETSTKRRAVLVGGPKHGSTATILADEVAVPVGEGVTARYVWDGVEAEDAGRPLAVYLHEGRAPEPVLKVRVEYGLAVETLEQAYEFTGEVEESGFTIAPSLAHGIADVFDLALRPLIAKGVNEILSELAADRAGGDGAVVVPSLIVPPGVGASGG
ncbi:MAG TPA: hypothetical protein EYQ24_10475 [Bacteroidetes bacterium]|nr:hypothetical protein [Bacteroidota bacterium]HIL58695.1 hypothetical protein [Rhodothermales bacterium]